MAAAEVDVGDFASHTDCRPQTYRGIGGFHNRFGYALRDVLCPLRRILRRLVDLIDWLLNVPDAASVWPALAVWSIAIFNISTVFMFLT
jgi:hypothetical protein